MIQVRNVPENIHRRLKARAAQAGLSLSDYVVGELRKVTERPTMEELRKRLQQMDPVELPKPAAQMVARNAIRDNLTAYDAAYVALAEALDATLLT